MCVGGNPSGKEKWRVEYCSFTPSLVLARWIAKSKRPPHPTRPPPQPPLVRTFDSQALKEAI